MKKLNQFIIEKLKLSKNTYNWKNQILEDINEIFNINKAYSSQVQKIIEKFINTVKDEYVIIASNFYESNYCKKYDCKKCIYKFLDEEEFGYFDESFDNNRLDLEKNFTKDQCSIEILIKEELLAINANLTKGYGDDTSYINIILVPKSEV